MNVKSFFPLPKFPVDSSSLLVWCGANVPGYVSGVSDDNNLRLVTSAELNPTQQAAVKAHLASLVKETEASKLVLPHNLIGLDRVNFENAAKAVIATKTFDQLSAAQKTLFMGGHLSDADYDSLPIS
jgi:hypothetical protein